MKVDRLQWDGRIYGPQVVGITLNCADFDQALRFITVLKDFMLSERANEEAPQPPEASAGENDAADQGQISFTAQQSSGPNGQHPDQANAGSVR